MTRMLKIIIKCSIKIDFVLIFLFFSFKKTSQLMFDTLVKFQTDSHSLSIQQTFYLSQWTHYIES